MDRSSNVRIGILVGDFNDPFWAQVLEGTYQAAQSLQIDIFTIYENLPEQPSEEQEAALLEELLILKPEILLDCGMPVNVARRLLDEGSTLVHLVETDIQNPRSFSPIGLYDAAFMAGSYLAETLQQQGKILVVGGKPTSRRPELGQSRIKGFLSALADSPQIYIEHISSGWLQAMAYNAVDSYLQNHTTDPFNAIFGISDTIAVAARDAARDRGCLTPTTQIVGINGDPFALAAIASGTMSATIETSGIDLGRDAVNLAYNISRGQISAAHYPYRLRLVTPQNVLQVSAEKLIATTDLPNRLVIANRKMEQERYRQLETSLEINRRVGSILDLDMLSQQIAELIKTSYGYDEVQLYRWDDELGLLVTATSRQQAELGRKISEDSPLKDVLRRGAPLFIPDMQKMPPLAAPGEQQKNYSRLILPVHFSEKITHLLDLKSSQAKFHTRQDLIGLQSLADQFGVAIRNAELYQEAIHLSEEALRAKTRAEQADNLKTRLLANVSHELRTPLNIILGYSQSALAKPNPYQFELPQKLQTDLLHIQESGEHLVRLINDLLDLSRAEINALDLFIEVVNPNKLFSEAFHSIADSPTNNPDVTWRLDLPDHLPSIHVDPLRIRQILLNLLSNARKFTQSGEITLGADISLPHLHVWVKDTGHGIPADAQEKIFEPFFTAQNAGQRPEGIGLGLSITRRLVALHGGSLSLDSQAGQGSTFHIYLPLPNLSEEKLPAVFNPNAEPVALLISHQQNISPALARLCERQNLQPVYLHNSDGLANLLSQVEPHIIAWDIEHASPGDWSLIQTLRYHPHLCQLPFLLLSSDEAPDKRIETMMTNVLMKPVQANTLLKFIHAMQPSRRGGSILIVDDDPIARQMYEAILVKDLPDYQIVSLPGGAEALRYLSSETPSMILLDLMMPEVDGFKVLEVIRSQSRTAVVPVLVMSGQMLSYKDVKRLNYDRVVFQPKDVLTPEEISTRLTQTLSGNDALPSATSELVKRALVFIQQNYDRTFTLPDIAHEVGVSKNYLSQIFREEMGVALWDYLNRYRVSKAKELLHTTTVPITEISLRVGFEDFSYFGRVFNKYCACSPRAFRQQARPTG